MRKLLLFLLFTISITSPAFSMPDIVSIATYTPENGTIAAKSGEIVTCNIIVENKGNQQAIDVSAIEEIPVNMTYDSGNSTTDYKLLFSSDGINYSASPNQNIKKVKIEFLADFPAGRKVSVIYKLKVK